VTAVGRRGHVRVGTSGWIYRHWRGVFYPERLPVKSWFEFYCRHFDTVEINNTFYRLPAAAAFKAWRQQAPPGFVYALKASRFLTHMKKLKDPAEPLERFLSRAREVGEHLGPLLYQLPPHWRADAERLRQFVRLLPRDLEHVFEFRDRSWYNDEVRAVLAAARVGFCIHDMRGAPCPDWVTGPISYVRFHGPTETAYAGSYSRGQLEAWAERIESVRDAGHDVYVYFNNDWGGHAVTNARQLKGMLEGAAVGQGA